MGSLLAYMGTIGCIEITSLGVVYHWTPFIGAYACLAKWHCGSLTHGP